MIRLHGFFHYDRSGKARWLLTELGVPFEDRWLDRDNHEYQSPDYLRMNPMGRVPVLEDGDQAIFESGAICAYLADKYIERSMAPALSSPDRADYQKWMYFAATTLDPVLSRVMIIEDIPPGELQKRKETELQDDLRSACTALDRTLSKNSFLVGNRFSTADICVSYHLAWCRLWPELDAVVQEFPSVKSYLERLQKLPSAVKSQVFTYRG